MEAAENYHVEAAGITLSSEQQARFNELRAAHPEATAQVELKHYHTLASEGRQFDKVVSIGMAEHIGRQYLPKFFADLKKLLKPGGLGLLHCITGVFEGETNPWITKYIFPGGYIPTIQEVVQNLSRQGMVVWDMENLGRHYAMTLDRWEENFERNADWALERYGKEFVRMWRLYLRSCASNFRLGHIFVHQTLFSNGKPDRLPLTREHLYAPGSLFSEHPVGFASFPTT
jgi:cyclopropane-fatty-acyl-phospholipid synthase